MPATDPLWLPCTPSIRRIARGFLGFDPWGSRDADGYPLWTVPGAALLPLHFPAGLAIARVRLREVGPAWLFNDSTPEEIAQCLRDLDPEMKRTPNARD